MDTGNPEVGIARVAKKGLHPLQAPLNAVRHMREKLFEQRIPRHLVNGSGGLIVQGRVIGKGVGRVADATALAPRRSDDAIAVAMARSSNNGDGVVPPQPFNL